MDTSYKDTSILLQSVVAERPCEEQTDEELVRLALAGCQSCFQVLVNRYYYPVFSVIQRILKNTSETEDAIQETFMKMYFQLGLYDDSHKFSTWILTIGSRVAIDHIRKQHMKVLSLEDAPSAHAISDSALTPEQLLMEKEYREHVRVYLNQLPPKYRAAVFLRYWKNLSYDEIAQSQGITSVLVKARLHRARTLLERIIRQ